MNETLEALARALFKAWFVDFEPFGGVMPEDWYMGKVADLGEVICGKTPPTNDPANYEGDVQFVTIPDMHGKVFVTETTRTLSTLGVSTQLNKTLPIGTICVSCIATPGLVAITSRIAQTNQQINSVVPKSGIGKYFAYYTMRGLADQIRARGSGGSVFLNLNKNQLISMIILIPDSAIQEEYERTVKPIFQKILANEMENQTLAVMRDALLPRLLSGEITVPCCV